MGPAALPDNAGRVAAFLAPGRGINEALRRHRAARVEAVGTARRRALQLLLGDGHHAVGAAGAVDNLGAPESRPCQPLLAAGHGL